MKATRKKRFHEFAIALATALLFIMLDLAGVFNFLELKSLDTRFRLRGPRAPHPDLVMVNIGENAVSTSGAWPFDRKYHAGFLFAARSRFLEFNPIVFDIIFSKPSTPSSDGILGKLSHMAGNAVFATRFRRNVPDGSGAPDTTRDYLIHPFTLALDAPEEDGGLYAAAELLNPPIPQVSKNAAGMGFINMEPDPDGICRRAPAVLKYRGRLYLQLALAGLAHYYKVDYKNIEFDPGRSLTFKNAIEADDTLDIRIPLDKDGNVIINWAGGWSDIRHGFYQQLVDWFKLALNGRLDSASMDSLQAYKGKIALVGYTVPGSQDYSATPFEELYYKPGLHYNLMNTVLKRDFIREAALWQTALLIVILCMVLAAGLYYVPPYYRALAAAVYLGVFLYVCYSVFARYSLWLRAVSPGLAVVFTFGSMVFYRYISEFRAKKLTKSIFQKYVTKDVMDQLLANPDLAKPGGEKKDVTIFFSDIRGFTAMSEKHSAKEMVDRLNEYLNLMAEIVFEYKGTIDKFVGDEIMAYFGAPLYPENHALRAVKAAIIMQNKMEELEARWVAEGKHVIRIGVGINTGEVVIGNVGASNFMDYTLIGDHVNLASRLCDHARSYKNEILLSENTYQQVSAHVEVIQQRGIVVKGKVGMQQVYSVMNFIEDLSKEKRRYKRREVPLEICYRIEGVDKQFEDAVVNISSGGFTMVTKRHIPEGRRLHIELILPNEICINNTYAFVLACAESGDHWSIRAVFDEISVTNRNEIIKFVYLEKGLKPEAVNA